MPARNFKRKLAQEDIQVMPDLALEARKARRVESRSELEVDLKRMEDYLINGQKHSASRVTVTGYRNKCITVFNKMEHIEYSKDFVREYKRRLDEDEAPATTQFIYLHALQALFRAVLDEPDYRIAKPVVKPDLDDTGKYWTPEEVERLINSVNISTVYGIRDRAILSTLYFGALRNQELCHQMFSNNPRIEDDVDVDNRAIKVQAHGSWHPKSYQNRKINLPDVWQGHMKAWLVIREREGFDRVTYPWVFITAAGTPLQDYTLREIVERYCEKAGLTGYPHKLRHSRCSFLANIARWPPKDLMKFMGHSSIEVTMRYIHTSDEEQRRLVDAVKEINV